MDQIFLSRVVITSSRPFDWRQMGSASNGRLVIGSAVTCCVTALVAHKLPTPLHPAFYSLPNTVNIHTTMASSAANASAPLE